MTWGVTSSGVLIKPLATILSEINASQLANISPALNLSASSALGQVNGIVSDKLAELWQFGLAVNSAYDPDQASGVQLASLSLLTSTKKRGQTYSIVTGALVNLNAGTTLPMGSLASVAGQPTITFATTADVTNAGGVAASVAVNFQATLPGPILAPAGTLTVIAQTQPGWNSVTNPTDAVAGLPVETDPQLRIRRVAELQSAGAATAGAIRAGILQALGQAVTPPGDVVSCTVLWNDTNSTDVNGLPPHSFEVIALGAVGGGANDALLAQEIMSLKTAGDQATGLSTLTLNDSQGNPHNIGFTRPTAVPIYVLITVKTDPLTFPADGAAEIKNAIVTWAQASLAVGTSVVIERIKSIAFQVPGVIDVTATTIGTAPAPAGVVNIPIGIRQIATISSANVGVTVT